MKKKTIRALRKSLLLVCILSCVLVGISIIAYQPPTVTVPTINKQVDAFRPLVDKYAKQYGVTDHVDILLAMMMQESGGRGEDPMQSSESYCGKPGCITNPELSIKQGVSYFSETLKIAEGDVKLAIQSYNFGKGFIQYVKSHSGSYSLQAAIDFSKKMYEAAEDKSIYTCLRREAKQYHACYGDIYYVKDVLKYRDAMAYQ